MASHALTLLTRPGCHLCDTARETVASVVGELDAATQVTIVERSIADDVDLATQYAEEIPVLLLDGRVHAIWRVDPTRLRAALMKE